jgi:hypothetical protein
MFYRAARTIGWVFGDNVYRDYLETEFYCRLAPGVPVSCMDILVTETGGGLCIHKHYAQVVGLRHTTDAETQRTNEWLKSEYAARTFLPIPEFDEWRAKFGGNTEDPQGPRVGNTIAKCVVFSGTPPFPSGARVSFPDPQEILEATGANEIRDGLRVPAGLIELSNGTHAPFFLDALHLLGSGLYVGGKSGLATKTSYAMFLISATFQKYAEAAETAAIVVNVKQDDLLHIHEPNESMTDVDRKLWHQLGLKPIPFARDRVHYLLPTGEHTDNAGKPNSHSIPNIPYDTYAYTLANTKDKIDLLVGHFPDVWRELGPLTAIVQRGLASGPTDTNWGSVKTWSGLLDGPPLLDLSERRDKGIGEVRAGTVNRLRRVLREMAQTRQSGIFADELSPTQVDLDQKMKEIKGGHIYVVDVYNLREEEKTLVLGGILRALYQLYTDSKTEHQRRPKKVIIFVDELNRYLRYSGSPLCTDVDRVLRLHGLVHSPGIGLFAAEQSPTDSFLNGTFFTTAYGPSSDAMLARLERSHLISYGPSVTGTLASLKKGQLFVEYNYRRRPVIIKFPVPAYKQPS